MPRRRAKGANEGYGLVFCARSFAMRWLVLCLFACLLVLLIASAAMAFHIYERRRETRTKLRDEAGTVEETDLKPEA